MTITFATAVLFATCCVEQPVSKSEVWDHYQAGEWDEAIKAAASRLCGTDRDVDDERLLKIIACSRRRLLRARRHQDDLPTVDSWRKKSKQMDRGAAIQLLSNWIPEARTHPGLLGHVKAVGLSPSRSRRDDEKIDPVSELLRIKIRRHELPLLIPFFSESWLLRFESADDLLPMQPGFADSRDTLCGIVYESTDSDFRKTAAFSATDWAQPEDVVALLKSLESTQIP